MRIWWKRAAKVTVCGAAKAGAFHVATVQRPRVCGAAKAGAFHSAHAEMQLLSMLLATNHVVELSRLSRLKHDGMIRAGIIAYGAQPGWTVPLSHGRSG